jgi:hypothetical protein
VEVNMSDGGQQRASSRATVRIEDRRQLGFPAEALLEALLAMDHKRHGWLWRAVSPKLHIEGAEPKTVIVEALRLADSEPERVEFDLQYIAAAIIHYCWLEHVPVPRGARKEVRLTAEGAVLLLSQTITI